MSRSLTRLIRLVTITPLVLLMLVRVVAAAEPKTIVVLHSYGQNFKPWSEYSKALRQELERRSSWPLIVDDFSVTRECLFPCRTRGGNPHIMRVLQGE